MSEPLKRDDPLAILSALFSNPYISLADLVYSVRERELKGWDGPAVVAWSEAVVAAQDLLDKTREEKAAEKYAFTPGPWAWVDRSEGSDAYHDLVGSNGARVHSDGSAHGEYGPDIDVRGPDARLIAAAPELLAACEDALERLEYVISAKPDFVGYGPRYTTIENLKRVIAKAKGESR